MTEEEFSRRLTEAIVKTAFEEKRLPFGRDPGLYAVGVVNSYWREFLSHGGSPERFAREDALHWHD